MKKRQLVSFLLVAIIALTFISCDGNLRSQISDLMDSVSGNVYIDNGMIAANLADAEAVTETVTSIGDDTMTPEVDSSSTTGFSVTIGSIKVEVATDSTPLAAMDETAQEELKDDLSSAFNSPTQKAALLETLSGDASPAQQEAADDSIDLLNATLEELTDALPDGELKDALAGIDLTAASQMSKGDVLLVQLMTNLVSNTITTLDSIEGKALSDFDDDTLANYQSQLSSIAEDAQFVLETANNLSGIGSIDFVGQIDFASIFDSLSKDAKAFDLNDASVYLGTMNKLAPKIIKAMGISVTGTVFSYSQASYESFLENQKTVNSAIALVNGVYKIKEQVENSGEFNAVTRMMNALISEAIVRFDAFCATDDTLVPYTIIQDYLNANVKLGLGTLTTEDSLGDEFPWLSAFKTYLHGLGNTYFVNLVNTLKEFNRVSSEGMVQLSTALDSLLDTSDGDSPLTQWYYSLVE
ncbi:hypothetical protein [uncultured Sphaerochaeta sp.]|uniref:hypothetical protein n=1 Tax=uncultured Sphaerochaeta sp. TaxID=886478 RepID=UPI002A0A9197|nr:hypothetical protein [uncultured Sphaerochaeta sp.]